MTRTKVVSGNQCSQGFCFAPLQRFNGEGGNGTISRVTIQFTIPTGVLWEWNFKFIITMHWDYPGQLGHTIILSITKTFHRSRNLNVQGFSFPCLYSRSHFIGDALKIVDAQRML